MQLEVRLDSFEGPLDLLLHLLEKNKVSIYDIPIAEITEQYLDCIKEMQKLDLDGMSEFLVMAATLLDIKSRMLLPAREEGVEEEDPRAELVEQLLQYKLYKYLSEELKDRGHGARKQAYKKPTLPEEVAAWEQPADPEELTKDVGIEDLNAVFQSVMRRQADRIDPVRSNFSSIEKEQISMDEKMLSLRDYASSHRSFSFRNLLERQNSKTEIVVTFLSVLEMMRTGEIRVSQEHLFGDIEIISQIAA